MSQMSDIYEPIRSPYKWIVVIDIIGVGKDYIDFYTAESEPIDAWIKFTSIMRDAGQIQNVTYVFIEWYLMNALKEHSEL